MTAPITISNAAATRIRHLLESRGKPSAGVKVGVRSGGCSGLSYTIEYADEVGPFDEVVHYPQDVQDDSEGEFDVLIDPKAIMYLIGTQMDFVEEKMKSGFVFTNPNEKGRCGCGESFHV
jgi:iron-sulfur cluster assembly protein